jgi:hypothetical protein
MVLAIVVVNQSIMGWPPLQDKLSTRTRWFQPDLRQSHGRSRNGRRKPFFRFEIGKIGSVS